MTFFVGGIIILLRFGQKPKVKSAQKILNEEKLCQKTIKFWDV